MWSSKKRYFESPTCDFDDEGNGLELQTLKK